MLNWSVAFITASLLFHSHIGAETLKGLENSVAYKPITAEHYESRLKHNNHSTADTKKVERQILVNEEHLHREVHKQALLPLIKSIKNGKAPKIPVEGVVGKLKKAGYKAEGISTYNWGWQKPGKSLSSWLGQFRKIADFQLDSEFVYSDFPSRDKKTLKPSAVQVSALVDLRGIDTSKNRRNDRGRVKMDIRNIKGTWTIEKIVFVQMESVVASRKPAFSDETLARLPSPPTNELRREAIRRGGYGLALADFDNDGHLDMYLGARSRSYLYRGNSKGVFKAVKADAVTSDSLVKSGVFADFDNDGDRDLVVSRFIPNNRMEELKVYENRNGEFIYKKNALGKRHPAYYPMPVSVADFNQDGYSDFYVGFPGAKDFTFARVAGHAVGASTKRVNGLFMNDTKGGFRDATVEAGLTEGKGFRQFLFPHSSLAVDFDQDLDTDLVVIDDRDNLSPVFQNTGKGKFIQVAEKIGLADSNNSMSAAVGDFNSDGLLDFALTNINLSANQRLFKAREMLFDGRDRPIYTGKGLRIFQQRKDGGFSDVTSKLGVASPGFGAAGLEFVDYNNDGHLDIYLTNGLWSGKGEREDTVDGLFAILGIQSKIGNKSVETRSGNDESNSPFMKMLINEEKVSFAGFQRNRLFRNKGDGTFVEVGYLEGVDSITDGYVVATADIDKDGRQDLVLRNGDPGHELKGHPIVQIYRNNFPVKNSLRLDLVGTRANPDASAVGLTVTVKGQPVRYRQVITNNGPSQSESTVHVGLGKAKKAEKVVVHWPQGDQVIRNLKAGTHKIVQPKKKDLAQNQ